MRQNSLWEKLCEFQFDETGTVLSFADRLAEEQGWSKEFGKKVIDEYRRFLYLAIIAEHPVTPSREVDEAWHLHLCYTRSYWDELCGKVLGRPLHHGPTRGGVAEDEKFVNWYERTLASYRRVFEAEPPADIWPPSKLRFGPNPWRRVDGREFWVVRKSAAVWSAAAGLAFMLLAGCSGSSDGSFGHLVIGLIIAMVIVGKLSSGRKRRRRKFRGRKGCGSSGCDSSGCGSSGCGSSGCGSSGCGGGGGD